MHSTEPPATASPIPDGTYETTLAKADWRQMTNADWLKAGVSEEEAAVWRIQDDLRCR